MQPISAFMHGRDNNFNLLRIVAALFIAFYHCYFNVFGLAMDESIYRLLFTLSQITLNFFFITSGFLIAQSFDRRKDLASYIAARFLRLVPGLFALSIVIAFIVGPVVTNVSLQDYFTNVSTWIYVPLTTLFSPDMTLSGVFDKNVNPDEIDSALWTLRYEVICYIGLAVAGVIGLLKNKQYFMLVFVLLTVLYFLVSALTNLREIAAINHLMHFGLSFLMGTLFYLYRDRIPLNWGISLVLIGSSFLLHQFVAWNLSEPLMILASTYTVFCLAYLPKTWVRSYNQLGDYSYGVYIYHYPIQQIWMKYFPVHSPTELYVKTLPFIIVCAILSWVLIEKPSLNRLPVLSGKLQKVRDNLMLRWSKQNVGIRQSDM